MLLKITDGQALDERKLMDVYAESNLENTDFFCPEEPDKEAAVRMVESGFLDFLKNEFFKEPQAVCWVLEEDGVWVRALRICRIPEGPYYLEALETRPDRRRHIDAFDINMSYNTAAKVRPWSDMNINLRLKWWKNYTFNMNAVFLYFSKVK